MKFLTRITVLIYVSLILFLACELLFTALHQIDPSLLVFVLSVFYFDQNLRVLAGILGILLLVINFFFYRSFSVNVHREKIIAFDNPLGRVRVSLMAIEDFLKRIIIKLPEIKDVRPSISASKKSLNVKLKLSLCAEVHIPDFSSKVQEMVSKKIQDIIGLLEPVKVEIYIGKILPEKSSEEFRDNIKEKPHVEAVATHIPFWGYRP